jgi:uncharacterized protein
MSNSILEKIQRFRLGPAGDDERFSISVSLPEGEHERGTLPILFVMDADISFGIAAEMVGANQAYGDIRPAIVVGVGYGAAISEMLTLRTRDLTSPLGEANKGRLEVMAPLTGMDHGGAERLLSFIVDELRPEIARRYPQASFEGNMIFGHSLGGLFVGRALLTRPDAFAVYCLASPSLWWDDFSTLELIAGLPLKLAAMPRQPSAFVCVGALEQVLPDTLPEAAAGAGVTLESYRGIIASNRMVDAAREFAEALKEAGVARCSFEAFSNEDHMSVVSAAISRSVRFAFKPD